MTESTITENGIKLLRHIDTNMNIIMNYLLDDSNITDGTRLARIVSVISDIQAQLTDLDLEIKGVKIVQ